MKQVNLTDGRVSIDYVHVYVTISPQKNVSDFMLYLKGESALMIFDRYSKYRNKWVERNFCSRG